MLTPELIETYEHEVFSAPGLTIMLEEGLKEYVAYTEFSMFDFREWTAEKGLEKPESSPLTIHVRDHHSAQDQYGDDVECYGGFIIEEGRLNINLYIGSMLEDFDLYCRNIDKNLVERVFNETLNLSLVHEVEHYVEAASGSIPANNGGELLMQRVVDLLFNNSETQEVELGQQIDPHGGFLCSIVDGEFSWQRLDSVDVKTRLGTKRTAKQIDDEITALTAKFLSLESYYAYASQEHEVRAREASKIYPLNHEFMIWLTLKPSRN
jgi:hypothetical protein